MTDSNFSKNALPGNSMNQLAAEIMSVSHLRGQFLLRSGQTSLEYFDKYLFESKPNLLAAVAKNLVPMIPKETTVLAGLEMGGIPIATALSLNCGLPVCFVRKQAKSYGTRKLAEGCAVEGENVLLIEDVITTGGQVALSCTALRSLGAKISSVLCVIDRSPGDIEELRKIGLNLYSLFTMAALKSAVVSLDGNQSP